MTSFGQPTMKKTKYEVAKAEVQEYIETMNNIYLDKKEEIRLFKDDNHEVFEMDAYFDYNKSVQFIRLWDIINNEITPAERNLLIAVECSKNYSECIKSFEGTAPKNVATLKVLVYNARKKIRKIYTEKYGNNNKPIDDCFDMCFCD